MAEIVVSFALETIVSMLVGEVSISITREEVEFMKEDLMLMKAFLRDADAINSKDETTIHLKRQIKTLTYRIEDVLETYATIRRRRGIKSALKRFISMEDIHTSFVKIKADIQSTITMISAVRLSVGFPNRVQMDESTAQDNHPLLRQTYAHGVNDYLVGMDSEIESLASLMVDDEKECCAISIYGMGGMGKSTLAKKLFNLSLVQNHFQAFAWVYVGKDHDIERILQSILKQLLVVESREKVEYMEKIKLLYLQVNKVLHEKRCLVVLDDIWSIKSWDSLRISAQGTASKILLTTRIREVAEHVSREEFVRKMRPLNDNEDWELFKTRAFLREDSADVKVHPMIEEMGKQILKQCRGVPLAIIMLGDFMGTKHTLREWEIMYKSSESYLSRGQQLEGSATILQILALSYDNLPLRIKLCFLHLGNFPEEAYIEVEKLYLLWMAEGIIEQEHCRNWVTMKDKAEDYLNELALQGMIEVQKEEVPIFRKFKSCRLHGLMREVCLLKGTEEEFMTLLDFRRGNQLLENSDAFYSTMATRRLAVYLDNHEDRSVAPLMRDIAKHIHCLLIRATREDQQELVWPREIFCIKEFRLLKVLDFDGLDFRKTKLPDGIAKLLSLRYLSFKGCFLSELPLCIGSMLNLQILDLRVKTYCTMIIPDVLWKIITLKCLYFPQRFRALNDTKLRLDGLTVLETLHGINAGSCRITDLLKMTNLRQLSAIADCSLEDLKLIIRLLDRNSFEEFRSSLDVRNFDCYTEERHSVFIQLLGGRNLHVFHIEGHIGQLPSEHHISKSFVEIVLSGSELKKDPMAILGKLPDLQVLVLKDEACLAEKIICPESGFLKLKRLELSNLRCLKEWTLEARSLCMLSKLTIESCRELKTLPDGLRSLCSLQKVMIIKMSSPFRHALLGKWEDTYTSEYVDSTLILSPKLVL